MEVVAPWRPFRDVERMSRMFDHMVDRMFRESRWPIEIERGAAACQAPVECFVRDNSLVVRVGVPGIEPKDIDVSLLGNVLTVRGERKSNEEIKKSDYLRKEIAYGAFERRLTLPEEIEAESIRAQFTNGVVEITAPLAKERAARKIPLVGAT